MNEHGHDGYDCTAAMAELDAFLRGELPVADAERMRVHLDRCQHCRQIGAYERAFRDRLQAVGGTGCCPEALRQRIAALLTQGDAAG